MIVCDQRDWAQEQHALNPTPTSLQQDSRRIVYSQIPLSLLTENK